VTLDGSASSDPDGDTIDSYTWSLTEVACNEGSADVSTMQTRLMNENSDWEMQTSSEQLVFTAPRPQCEGLTMTFQLVVSDGETQSNPSNDQNATALVSYGDIDNNQPFARITGPSQASCGDTITLNGTESTDVDGDTLQYTWNVQSGEPAPELSSEMGESIEVTIPDSVPSDTTYEITLTLFDGFVNSEPDTQVIVVDACSVGGDAGLGDAGAADTGGLPSGDPSGSGCVSSTTGQRGVPGALLGVLLGGIVVWRRRG
jgi:MYXO-CTERM domain-containing protein